MGETGTGYFRAVLAAELDVALRPVASYEGRFHHTGQPALYLSETVDGVVTAMQSYLAPDDPAPDRPERLIVPVRVTGGHFFDARDEDAVRALGAAPGSGQVRWRDDRAEGRRPASWDLSDRARASGADGMLYSSRKRPDLTHLVLFRWNGAGGARVVRGGAPLAFRGG